MRRFARYFLDGLLILVPIIVTVYVFYMVFVTVDRMLRMPIPGLGFVITLGLVTFVGFLASNFITKKLLDLVNSVFTRLPLVKLLYSSIRDLVQAFIGEKKTFDRPVLVKLSEDGHVWVLGFVTRDSLEHLGLKEMVSVYVPQSYNFAGNLLLVPRQQVQPLNVSSSDAMTFILSGGVSGKQ